MIFFMYESGQFRRHFLHDILRATCDMSLVWCRFMEELKMTNLAIHTEKLFRNLIKSNRNQIAFTIFRLFWNSKWTSVWFQINRKMLNRL